jgi:alkylation response protein AidB-like acyl-CoA dehydrogenase
MNRRNSLCTFLRKWVKLGLMGVLVPESYGGAGLGYFEYSAVIQEIAKSAGR